MAYVRELVAPASEPKTFWTVEWDGKKSVTTRSGKVGKPGRAATKKFADDYAARSAFFRTSNQKLIKGGFVCRHAVPSETNGYIRLLMKARAGNTNFVDIHPTTNHVAIGSADAITIVDLDGVTKQTIEHRGDGIRRVRFSPDGRYLAWQDNKLGPQPHVYDFTTKKQRTLAKTGTGQTEGLAFDATGKRLLVTLPHKSIVFDTKTWKSLRELAHVSSDETATALSPNGKQVAVVSSNDSSITIYDVDKQRAKTTTLSLGKGRGAMALAFSPDGQYLVAASVYQDGHSTRIFDLETSKRHLPRIFSDSDNSTHFGVDISPDNQWIATAGYSSDVEVRSLARGKLVLHAWDHYRRVYDVRFSRDGKYLVTADYNAGFVVVHALTEELLANGFTGPSF